MIINCNINSFTISIISRDSVIIQFIIGCPQRSPYCSRRRGTARGSFFVLLLYFYRTKVRSLPCIVACRSVTPYTCRILFKLALSNMLHLSKLLQGFVKNLFMDFVLRGLVKIHIWISISCYMDLSKFFYVILVICQTKPSWNMTKISKLLWTKGVELGKVLSALGPSCLWQCIVFLLFVCWWFNFFQSKECIYFIAHARAISPFIGVQR